MKKLSFIILLLSGTLSLMELGGCAQGNQATTTNQNDITLKKNKPRFFKENNCRNCTRGKWNSMRIYGEFGNGRYTFLQWHAPFTYAECFQVPDCTRYYGYGG